MNPKMLPALAAAFWLAGCGPKAASADGSDSSEPRIVRRGELRLLSLGPKPMPGLRWEAVRRIELPGTIEAAGLVNYDPRRVATIVSRVQGRIEDTRVSLWDGVRQGDPIVQLYSPDYMTAEAEYLQARVTSKESSGTAQGADGVSDALAEAAKQKLKLLGMSPEDMGSLTAPEPTIWVRAPIGGTVVDAKVVRGSAVNPGDVLFTLGMLDEVWITADIYEEDAPRLEVGQSLTARVAGYPGENFRGVISNVSPDINPDTHTLQVRSKVSNASGRLKPRMLANVTIFTHPGKVLGVPQEALVFDTDGYYVFVQAADGISRRRVEISYSGDKSFVQIRSGLKAGERVAVSETIQLNALWHRAIGEGS